MKSICIKTKNISSKKKLIKLLDISHIEHICYSCCNFKHYYNLIIHYTYKYPNNFISSISELLSSFVIENFEAIIIKRIIVKNYFYFDDQEKNAVYEIAIDLLSENELSSNLNKKAVLYNIFNDYFLDCNKLYLDGFINFRLNNYFKLLSSIVDDAVNHFIIEREYWEFISLLKIYINSESSSIEQVHLIYNNSESIILDEDNNIINANHDIFNAKFLSDITFSSNDYALNTLLNLLPKTIYVHISDGLYDEFINTLQLVFEDRIIIL